MPDQPWYREWRHEERATGFPGHQPRWKRALSAALVVGAIVFLYLNVRDVVGW